MIFIPVYIRKYSGVSESPPTPISSSMMTSLSGTFTISAQNNAHVPCPTPLNFLWKNIAPIFLRSFYWK
jgi:hypothetical protein